MSYLDIYTKIHTACEFWEDQTWLNLHGSVLPRWLLAISRATRIQEDLSVQFFDPRDRMVYTPSVYGWMHTCRTTQNRGYWFEYFGDYEKGKWQTSHRMKYTHNFDYRRGVVLGPLVSDSEEVDFVNQQDLSLISDPTDPNFLYVSVLLEHPAWEE